MSCAEQGCSAGLAAAGAVLRLSMPLSVPSEQPDNERSFFKMCVNQSMFFILCLKMLAEQ